MPSLLPPELAPALRARRHSLASQASGEVLDLGGWTDHLSAYPDDAEITQLTRLDEIDETGGGFDTIVSMIRTPLVADIEGFFRRLAAGLAEGGRLLVLEPTIRTGRAGQMLALGNRLSRPFSRFHLDRDIPADLRRSGLFVTDLHRFDVPSVSAPFRPFVEAHCRWPTPPPEDEVS